MEEVCHCGVWLCRLKFHAFAYSVWLFFLFVSCIYGESVKKFRPTLWERITRLGIHRKESWCLIGDFNDILQCGEKVRGHSRSDSSCESFVNIINACKMEELPSHSNALTWGGMRYQKCIQCRLYRCFGNKAWFLMFPVSNEAF